MSEPNDDPRHGFDWSFSQTYEHLLLVHWPVDPIVLATCLPKGLEVATFNGAAWIGHDALHVSLPVLKNFPQKNGLDTFDEVTVRTFVKVGERVGLYLFSLDAPGHMLPWAMQLFFHMRAHTADVRLTAEGLDDVTVTSTREGNASASFDATYLPTDAPTTPEKGSLDAFLIGGDTMFTTSTGLLGGATIYASEVRHAAWSLSPAKVTVRSDGIAAAAGFPYDATNARAVYTRRQTSASSLPSVVR
jgi:hypothetical protein